uniref:Putative reverse transcriptase domain-containing protein n=1 Tax=Tanacetum cinerariifolium TaxID=118510 RepID=A0A699GKE2_TANCI|nr:putative reverse transcriptase domain-containing protein [Tanacetum cinerariifolium]
MAMYSVLISLDSSKESVGTPSGRVLWVGRIPTTMPATISTIDPPVIHDDTSLIPAKTPTISPITSTIPPTAPNTYYTSPFIYTDSSDDDTPNTPPSPTHEIPPVEVAPPASWILPASPGALSDYLPGHSSLDYSSPTLPSGMRFSHQLCSSVPSIPYSSAAITERPSHSSFTGPSHKRSRSPTTSVPVSSDESSESSVSRETGLRVDVDVRGSDEPYSEPDIDLRVVVETVTREEVETSTRGMVVVSDDRVTHPVVLDDILELAQEEGAIKVIKSIQRDQGHKIVAIGQHGAVMSERISELEWDNTRLRGMLDVTSQGVCKPYLDRFVIVFIDDILIYSKSKKEHEGHRKLILRLPKEEELYANFSKCDFWLSKGEPPSLFDFEEVMNNNHNQKPPPQNGPPSMVRPNGQAPRTMEELCQPSVNGRGGLIASILIQATDFGLLHHMIQQV